MIQLITSINLSVRTAIALLLIGYAVGFLIGWVCRSLSNPYEYGDLRGDVARRNRGTGAVETIFHHKGEVAPNGFVYRAEWWHPIHSDHWEDFEPYVKANIDK